MNIQRILHPRLVTKLIMIMISFVIWTFLTSYQIRTLWLMVPSIVFIVCTVIVTFVWVIELIYSRRLQKELELYELLQKKSISLSLSWIMSLLMSAFYIVMGFMLRSTWYKYVSLFYIALTAGRFFLLRQFRFDTPSYRRQYRTFVTVGYLMLMMEICLILMEGMVIDQHYAIEYPGLIVYPIFIFTLYLCVSTGRDMIRHSHYQSPLLNACQYISVSAALFGVFCMQVSLTAKYCMNDHVEHLINISCGLIIFLLMMGIALYMIIHGGRRLSDIIYEESRLQRKNEEMKKVADHEFEDYISDEPIHLERKK